MECFVKMGAEWGTSPEAIEKGKININHPLNVHAMEEIKGNAKEGFGS